ncbi:MAG TPA: hypothetical protein VG713_18015 [Pirellulales bacterium]|nr:hypothetical protein [Pirellulales bacterium]
MAEALNGIDLSAINSAQAAAARRQLLLAQHACHILGPLIAAEFTMAHAGVDPAIPGTEIKVRAGECIALAIDCANEVLRRCGI